MSIARFHGTFVNESMSNNMTAPGNASADAGVEALVRRVQVGDEAAFDELVRIFQAPMYNLAYRMVNNAEDASDIAQEIFVKAYHAIGKFRGESKFSTWLYALASNTCRSELRRLRRRAGFEVSGGNRDGCDGGPPAPEAVDPGDQPAKSVERAETMEDIRESVSELPEEFRMVMVMCDMQNLSYEEAAAALGCSIGTVKSRLFRARTSMKDKLRRKGLI